MNLIKAAAFVLRERRTLFMICGHGDQADAVKNLVEAECANEHVKLTGWVPHEDLPSYLNEMELLVLPSYTEGLPNILLEAMACGTPVLATPVGAIPYIIKNDETGFLLKSINPKHIADKIIKLLNKPKLLEKVSANAHKYVKENFSYENTLEAWRKIFKELEFT